MSEPQRAYDPVARIAALEAQLPDGMKDCTILFKECEKGHGRLVAANWIDNGCPWCRIAEMREVCALIADEWAEMDPNGNGHAIGKSISAAIRARPAS